MKESPVTINPKPPFFAFVVLFLLLAPIMSFAQDQYFESRGVPIRFVEAGKGTLVVLVYGYTRDGNGRRFGSLAGCARNHRSALRRILHGAETALKLATRHPEMVRSLFLVGSGWSGEHDYETFRLQIQLAAVPSMTLC
jgi:hypothetical protein